MKILHYIKSKLISRVAGVSIHYISPSEVSISYVVLKQEGGKLKTLSKVQNLNSFIELSDKLDKNLAVWLCITGRQVISRKLKTDPNDNYLHTLLPNAKETDFVVSVYETDAGEAFVSAVRFTLAQQWIDDFRSQNHSVLGFSIGPSVLSVLNLAGLLRHNEILVPGYQIVFSNNQLSDIVPTDQIPTQEYWVGTEQVENNVLVSFSVAFSYLIFNEGTDRIWRNALPVDRESYLFKVVNGYFKVASLVVLFVLLLINFLLFSKYSAKEKAITSELAYQLSSFKQVDSLRAEITQKTSLIEQMGLNSYSRYGFYADRIAATLPQGISLHKMAINPLQSKIKTEKEIVFEKRINIQGETTGSMALNDWINELKNLEWVLNINLINYEKGVGKGEFELSITY